MIRHLSVARAVPALLLVLCAAVPYLAPVFDEPFYVIVFARIMIWAIAATSLNLIMGYGGMISFGHAAFLGIGGYAVGILGFHDVNSAWIQLPVALGGCALVALVFGLICLRTRGIYFIMITLALAQMVFFLSVSAERYGSDDGLNIFMRSDFGSGWFDLENPLVMYYAILAVLLGSLLLQRQIVGSRFGLVLRASSSNDARVQAVGIPTYRYRLAAFVIAGVLCGAAGFLQANLERFVSPDMMNWHRSGELILMTVLGGTATLFGPVVGAFVFLLLSELLASITIHWHLVFGPFLILVVLFTRGGVMGLLEHRSRHA